MKDIVFDIEIYFRYQTLQVIQLFRPDPNIGRMLINVITFKWSNFISRSKKKVRNFKRTLERG